MKRAPWYVVTGAVAGFAAVFGLHGLAGAPAGLAQQKPAGGAAGGGTAAGGGDGPSATPTPTHRAAKGGGAGPSRTATGSLVNYGYGKLAVKVTVRGSNITVVSVSTLQTVDPFSQQLAQQDIPVLRSEVLAAHGARINAVSGATYTSQAYANSLQSALDKLHFG